MTKSPASKTSSKTSKPPSTSSSCSTTRRGRRRSHRPSRRKVPIRMKRKAAESAELPTAIIASKKASKKVSSSSKENAVPDQDHDKTCTSDVKVPDVADFQFEEADQEALSLFSTLEFDLNDAECLHKVELTPEESSSG